MTFELINYLYVRYSNGIFTNKFIRKYCDFPRILDINFEQNDVS